MDDWTIIIITGVQHVFSGSGFDGNVEIRLKGTENTTDWIDLDNPHHDDFEAGTMDSFKIKAYIGEFKDAEIPVRNQGTTDDWECHAFGIINSYRNIDQKLSCKWFNVESKAGKKKE